jgi:hypothetical protein
MAGDLAQAARDVIAAQDAESRDRLTTAIKVLEDIMYRQNPLVAPARYVVLAAWAYGLESSELKGAIDDLEAILALPEKEPF